MPEHAMQASDSTCVPGVQSRAAMARFMALTAFSMSIGWGIRGQFGHEIGAAIAGALGAMAVVLLSGRQDWLERVHHFALFGAIGWGFGGSMSYMKVVAYAQSSDSPTVLYGFAGLFLIGFLWAAPGGAGIAILAFLDRERLTSLFPALAAVIGAWLLQDIVLDVYYRILHGPPLSRFDSDWMPPTVAIAAVTILCAIRRKIDLGSSLVLHMAIGWWTGLLLLHVILGLRLNPPRGDDWAGCIGLVGGVLLFCYRNGLGAVAHATLITGFIGGTGFALGQAIKVMLVATGLQTNWHSVMEQTHGFFHGLAVASAMYPLIRRAPDVTADRRIRVWTEVFSVFFVLWVITYLNFRKSPADWVAQIKTIPEYMYGIAGMAGFAPSRGFIGWFDMVYIAFGAALLWLLTIHLRRPLPVIPDNWLGKGQLFYLVFLWAFVFINFVHVLGRFNPIRLVTEWVIAINAVICTVLLLAWPAPGGPPLERVRAPYRISVRRTVAVGLVAGIAVTFAGWGLKRAVFGDQFTGYFYINHIRFGPDNTNDKR